MFDTEDREGSFCVFEGGGAYIYIDDGGCRYTPPHSSCCHAGRSLVLSRSVDVQLTLQDVVDDGLSQVVHNMAVTVLQGQSDGGANMDSHSFTFDFGFRKDKSMSGYLIFVQLNLVFYFV